MGNHRKLWPNPPCIFLAHSGGEKMSALGGPDNGPLDPSVIVHGLKINTVSCFLAQNRTFGAKTEFLLENGHL